MKKEGFYSSGEFAHMAKVTVRTIRYYDSHDVLKPSFVSESGARFYTDEDFARLQQILLLKFLGFSLNDIKNMTIGDTDYHFMLDSLEVQLKLVRDKIEQLQLVETAIEDTLYEIKKHHAVNWEKMLNLIHLTGMEKAVKKQYQNATNISSRIRLHRLYSKNKKGWFPWIFDQLNLKDGMKVLEIGCGNGMLWEENDYQIPRKIMINLSDVSEGMLRDARRNVGSEDKRFKFEIVDAENIPYEAETFDVIIANHMLFYCENLKKTCSEIARVLKKAGMFVCSTYGKNHMKEVSDLVREFDNRIVLSADKLY